MKRVLLDRTEHAAGYVVAAALTNEANGRTTYEVRWRDGGSCGVEEYGTSEEVLRAYDRRARMAGSMA